MDLNKIISGLASSGAVSGLAGGLASGALVSALTTKSGRKLTKGALKLGALAAVGGLAYTAYQRYRGQNQTDPRLAPDTKERSWSAITQQRFAAVTDSPDALGPLLLLRAMITAAASDGHLDTKEQDRVFAEADRLVLTQEEQATLFDELRRPLSLPQLVAQIPNKETAIEAYAASLVAIDNARPEARAYLKTLAAALDLPPALVESIHTEVTIARQKLPVDVRLDSSLTA